MMDTECFNCVSPASNRYTVIIDGSKVVEDAVICEECVSEFQEEDLIKFADESPLMRGADGDHDESP